MHNGYGKHFSDLSKEEQIKALKWFFGAQILYKIVIAVNKVSFFCLYLRIFVTATFRRICYTGIGVITAWGLAYVFTTIFQCKPIAVFWDKEIKDSKCLDNETFWMSYSIINIVFDVIILALPINPVRKLKLPKAKKIGLLVIFGMGTLWDQLETFPPFPGSHNTSSHLFSVCATTIVRTTTLASSASSNDPTSTSKKSYLSQSSKILTTIGGPIPATIWSVVEANTGIICTCLPVFKHPLQMFFPKLFYSQPQTNPYSRSAPRRTPLASSSQRNLHDNQEDIGEDYGKKDFEMTTPKSLDGNRRGGITMVTDFKVTYGGDHSLDGPATPTRSREFR